MLRTQSVGTRSAARKRPWTSSKNCIELLTQSVKPRTLAVRQEQHEAIPALAISFFHYYSEQESVITIWAVAHGGRRPEYWTRRL